MDRIWRAVFEHRRLLAALFTGLAVLAALSALKASPDTTAVTVVQHDLRSGHVITDGDLRTAQFSADAVPAHVLERDEAVGRRVAGPMRAGESVTDYRVIQPGALAGYDAKAVLTTIRVDRADGASGVQVGDRVDVIAVDPEGRADATVIARGVEIVTIPSDDDGGVASLSVVTTEKNALALATAGLSSRFSVITSSS